MTELPVHPPGDVPEIVCLHMTAPPTRAGSPSPFRQAALMRAEAPPLSFYEYLQNTLSRSLVWSAWADLDSKELERLIADPAAELYVAYEGGVPAGFVELDIRVEKEPVIAGLAVNPELSPVAPERYLLEWALERLWRLKPDRITTQVVRRDHLAALAVLQRVGFEPYDGAALGKRIDPSG